MINFFRKYKTLLVGIVIGLLILIFILYFVFRSRVEYKDAIDYEAFDKNSLEDYNKYKENIKESRFDLKEDNKEIRANYNEIEGFKQVNIVINYEDNELTHFESLNPIVNVIKYNELYLVFVKENGNDRESLIVVNKEGNKIGEIIASDERAIISLEEDRIINKKYTTITEYPEIDESSGIECGKKEIYRLTENDFFLESYEYMYCLIDE